MPGFHRTRLCFFLCLCLVLTCVCVVRNGAACGPAAVWPAELGGWVLPCIMAAAALLMLAGTATTHFLHRADFLPRAGILWRLSVFSLLTNLCCNLASLEDPCLFPATTLLTLASVCLSAALLGRYSVFIWFPFLLLEFAQIVVYRQYSSRLNSLVIAETLEASGAEVAAYLSRGNILLAICAVLGSALLCFLLVRILRRQRARLPLFNTACLCTLLACTFIRLTPSPKLTMLHLWPPTEIYTLAEACTEAIFRNQATIRQAESLPSPALRPSSLHTLRGGEGFVLIVHIGESVRADRMSINGYKRDTTPWLRSCPRVINFPSCISAACDTCQAQIAILTDARRDLLEQDPALVPHTGSVLDLFAAHGFRVFSFFGRHCSSQLKYDLVVRDLTRCSEKSFHAPDAPWTSVPQMAELLRSLPQGQNTLLFINNEGSHTPFSDYDPKHAPFLPAGSNFDSPADHAPLVNNAYDNTIHYTDEFVRRVTSLLGDRPWLYLYVSDHGEYLGHDGMWGRAALGESGRDYHSTTGCRVGMFFIYSPQLPALHPHFAQSLRSLDRHKTMLVSHEHIFHTLLGFFDLRTPWYNRSLDLCSPSPLPYSGPCPDFPPPSPSPTTATPHTPAP